MKRRRSIQRPKINRNTVKKIQKKKKMGVMKGLIALMIIVKVGALGLQRKYDFQQNKGSDSSAIKMVSHFCDRFEFLQIAVK